MSRRDQILRGLDKELRGIEIGPWLSPLAPKRDGYNCLVLDVFEKDALVTRPHDPSLPADCVDNIESVDLVGSATDIAELVPAHEHGSFDYIVSSHNFEHLPDPIRFLQGCEKVLKPGGVLSMAIPDARACFDCFRPHTVLIEWLTAFRSKATKPSAAQIFAFLAYQARLRTAETEQLAFSVEADPSQIVMVGDLSGAYRDWLSRDEADPYVDAHCSVMTPASFRLLLAECNHLGLVSMQCVETAGPEGFEFFVRLVNAPASDVQEDISVVRAELSRQIWRERALPQIAEPAPPQIVEPEARVQTRSRRKQLSVKYVHPFKRRYASLLNRL